MKSKILRIISTIVLLSALIVAVLPAIPVSAAPADCYWVGDGGNWSDDDNHWATSSGGAPADGNLPDSSSNVHFDANSFTIGSQTVTQDISGNGAYCNDIDWTGVTNSPTFTNTSTYPLQVYGSITWDSSVIGTGTNFPFYMRSTSSETIDWGGAITGAYNLYFAGVGGDWTLASDTDIPDLSYYIYECTGGTFDTDGYDMDISNFGESITGSEPTGYEVYMRDSVIELSSDFSMKEIDGATIDFGSATITCTNFYLGSSSCSSPTVVKGTATITTSNTNTFYLGDSDIYLNDVEINCYTTGAVTTDILGTATFDNLTINTGTSTSDGNVVEFEQSITVAENFNCYGSNYAERLLLSTSSVHTQRTITAANVDFEYVDFKNIEGAGAADWDLSSITGGSGNVANNDGIIFTTAKTVYRVGTLGTQNWNDNNWSSTSNGSPSLNQIPLPQDTAVFDENSVITPGSILTLNHYGTCTIDCLDVTNTPQFSGSSVYFYGSLLLGSVDFDVTSAYVSSSDVNTYLSGHFGGDLYIDGGEDCYVRLSGDVIVDDDIYLTSGVFDLNDYDLQSSTFRSSVTTYDRTLMMGDGDYTLDDAITSNKWYVSASNLQVFAEDSSIVFTDSTNSITSTFAGAGLTYNELVIEGTGNYTTSFTGNNTFDSIYVDRTENQKTIAGTSTQTLTDNLYIPLSGTTVVTITNLDFTKTSGIVDCDYLSISGSAAGGGATYYAGGHSINGGSNSGWIFGTLGYTWTDEENAYDDNTGTTTSSGTVTGQGWSEYLILNYDDMASAYQTRYYISSITHAADATIEIDVYYDDAWASVVSGTPTVGSWVATNIDGGDYHDLSDIRIRYYNGNSGSSVLELAELRSIGIDWSDLAATAVNVTSDEHNILVTADGTDLEISIDGAATGDYYDSTALGGNSVPDESTGWLLDQSNVTPYLEYLKHTVSGTLITWYQPVAIIDGTTLPDREGTAQNGAITWGSNPVGVEVEVESLTSYNQPSPVTEIRDEAPRDLLPNVGVTDWYEDPSLSALATNPFRPLVTMVSDNSTLSETLTWRLFGLFIVIMATVAVAKLIPKHLAIACFAGGVVTLLLVLWSVFPAWALVLLVLFGIGGWVSERAPSL